MRKHIKRLHKSIKQKLDVKHGQRNITLFGASSFFNDIGSEMITPILPFYIGSLGGSGAAIGLLSGLREGLSSLFKLLGGWMSDRIGKRRHFVFLGYALSIIFRFLLIIANSWQSVLAFVSAERLGKMRDPPRDAVISVSTDRRGRGFGRHQMMDAAGAIVGTAIVLFLFWRYHLGYKTIIIIAACLSLLSLIPLFFVKEPKTKPINRSLFRSVKDLDKRLKYFVFVTAVFTMANFGLYMFLILRAEEITGSIIIAFFLYMLFSFAYSSFSIPFGNLSDKIGRKKVLMMGYTLFLLISIGFIYASTLLAVTILFFVYGMVYASTHPNQRAYISDVAGRMKGTAMGFYQSVTGSVNILAGLIAGILWDISYQLMFGYVAAIALLSIILLGFVREKQFN